MVSGNDPVECLFNSIQSVKDALLPLDYRIRKAVKDFEQCWPGSENRNQIREVFASWNSSDRIKRKPIWVDIQSTEFPLLKHTNTITVSDGIAGDDNSRNEVSSTCNDCLQFTVIWSVILKNFMPPFLNPFRKTKNRAAQKFNIDESNNKNKQGKSRRVKKGDGDRFKSLERLMVLICSLQSNKGFHKFDQCSHNKPLSETPACCPNLLNPVADIPKEERRPLHFLGSLKFARVGSVSRSNNTDVGMDIDGRDCCNTENNENREASSSTSLPPQKLGNGLLNMDRLRSTLSTVSLPELMELMRWPVKEHPDKKKLFSVQDFFRYTETEGRKFFEELDRDGDGRVTQEDLEVEMRKRKLPTRYAREVMRRTKKHPFSRSIGWEQFLSLMEQKEATIVRAYTGLCLSKSGTLHKNEILASLKSSGLPANDDNAVAMMRFLNADGAAGSVSYGHFRNFMVLLPSDRLQDDPRTIWFEAATVVAVPPLVEIPAGSVLKSALAGGLASALSTSLLHPIDTVKTRVQASSTSSFPEMVSLIPEIGLRGLYRGLLPAVVGQFSSHGLRTGIFEATKLFLAHFAPTVPDIQVQSVATLCSTFVGTAVRIPCEVLKQRLQAGLFDSVGDAVVGTWSEDGMGGFFRGTAATLCREIPFYVAGMALYAESKKTARRVLCRELEPWECVAVGAVSGGLAAVMTTPFDVLKTRMMTAPPGQPDSMALAAFSIFHHEGPLALFKGAVPRFFWIAPLGAVNFAGYELARKAIVHSHPDSPP